MSNVDSGAADLVTPVYGTVFADRARVVDRLRSGDVVILVPDPPAVEEPIVWVHAEGGDVVGHLSPHVSARLVPAMLRGTRCRAVVHAVAAPGTESWQRLQLRIRCRTSDDEGP
jgi:hypothetical protein